MLGVRMFRPTVELTEPRATVETRCQLSNTEHFPSLSFSVESGGSEKRQSRLCQTDPFRYSILFIITSPSFSPSGRTFALITFTGAYGVHRSSVFFPFGLTRSAQRYCFGA